MRINTDDVEFFNQLQKGEPFFSELTMKLIIGDIFPLHDADELETLVKKWHAAKLTTFEPSYDAIRDYFGEKISMYFAFLGFYTKGLILPSCLAVYNCLLWYNYDAVHAQAPFAAFNLLYLTVFLKLWKRRCSALSYRWGTFGSEKYESPRPAFKGTLQMSPVTGDFEISFSRRTRYRIMFFETYPLVLICLVIALLVMWGYYIIQLQVEKIYVTWSIIDIIMLNLPTIVYSILIEITNRLYKRMAYYLTNKENHRLQSEYEYHLLMKLILLQFMNCFSWLFYTAFVLQEMERLRRYLATLMITFQLIQQVQECLIPFLKVYLSKKYRLRKMKKTGAAADNDIVIESKMDVYEDTFDDYLEMWLQFGYAFMFSSVFPMAAFWAFLNNLLEMRSDAFKLCTTMRRPFPQSTEGLGIWQPAFEALIVIAVMTNCILLGMAASESTKFKGWSSVHIVLLFVTVEHAILFLHYLISSFIEDMSEDVRIRVARADYLMSKREPVNLEMARRRPYLVGRSSTINEESPTNNAYRRSSRLIDFNN